MKYDIIVIGAGPAGMTAALYAARADRQVLLLEKESFGGQVVFSPKIENYPGFLQMSGSPHRKVWKDRQGKLLQNHSRISAGSPLPRLPFPQYALLRLFHRYAMKRNPKENLFS